jgi:hypothetical protein
MVINWFNITKGILIISTLSLLLSSCQWMYSKDDYIQEFSDFIVVTNKESPNYTQKEWHSADSLYHQYSVIEFERFKNDFHEIDLKAISKLNALYGYLRLNGQAKELYKQSIHFMKNSED